MPFFILSSITYSSGCKRLGPFQVRAVKTAGCGEVVKGGGVVKPGLPLEYSLALGPNLQLCSGPGTWLRASAWTWGERRGANCGM